MKMVVALCKSMVKKAPLPPAGLNTEPTASVNPSERLLSDLSLQVEEIYDLVKENDENVRAIKAGEKREQQLIDGISGLCEMVNAFLPHIPGHAAVVLAKKNEILQACGLTPIGRVGEKLAPALHTTHSAIYHEVPAETIVDVLESGFIYRGKVIKKAMVILSKGAEAI